MKRDMDLIREILLEFEKSDSYEIIDAEKAGHVAIMQDAGLVVAAIGLNGESKAIAAKIMRLTWAGHDFIDNARKPEIWEKIKETFQDKVISASFDIIIGLLKAKMKSALGIPVEE